MLYSLTHEIDSILKMQFEKWVIQLKLHNVSWFFFYLFISNNIFMVYSSIIKAFPPKFWTFPSSEDTVNFMYHEKWMLGGGLSHTKIFRLLVERWGIGGKGDYLQEGFQRFSLIWTFRKAVKSSASSSAISLPGLRKKEGN